jgi:hypothetical protein
MKADCCRNGRQGSEMQRSGSLLTCSLFHPQGRVPSPSTRALLYFRRLWEVGEPPLFKDLGVLVILSLCILSSKQPHQLQSTHHKMTLLVFEMDHLTQILLR